MIAIEAVIGISLTMVDCENQPRRGGRVAEGGGLLNLQNQMPQCVFNVLAYLVNPDSTRFDHVRPL